VKEDKSSTSSDALAKEKKKHPKTIVGGSVKKSKGLLLAVEAATSSSCNKTTPKYVGKKFNREGGEKEARKCKKPHARPRREIWRRLILRVGAKLLK